MRVDIADCPLSNGTTKESYASFPTSKFTMFCNSTVTRGKNLTEGLYMRTFKECLDSCTVYNGKEALTDATGRCLSAAWVIQSPNGPRDNGICYFKGSTAVESSGSWNVVAGVLTE